MRASTDLPTQRSSPWRALFGASAPFLFLIGFSFTEYGLNGPMKDFVWGVTCNFGGYCSYAVSILGDGPVPPPPIVHWFNWKFILFNPGLWFGLVFSLEYAPNLFSYALPTTILGAIGLAAYTTAHILNSNWIYGFSGIFLIPAPYSALGALVAFAYKRLTQA